jgi:hypothetical protein
VTILESGEDESGPSDLLGHIVEQDHGPQSRQECGEKQQPTPGESAQRRETVQDRDGDQQDQQRSEQANQIPAQRHPPPEAAPGEVPHAGLSPDQGGNDKCWHSRPEDVLQYPVRCRSARKKSRLGQPLETKTRAVVVAYTSTKKVPIGCLTIHDLSGDASAAPTSAAGSAMIGTPLDSAIMRRHHRIVKAGPPGRHHRLRPVDVQLRDDVGGIVAGGWD